MHAFLSEESYDVPLKKHTLSRWHVEKFPSIAPPEKDSGRAVVWFKNIRLAEPDVHRFFPPQAHKISKPQFDTNPKQLVYRMRFFPLIHTSLLQLPAIAVNNDYNSFGLLN